MREPNYTLLGAWINALTISDLNALIAEAVKHGQRWIIAHHNLHSIYLYHHDPNMHAFYAKADYTHVDGMALILLGGLLGLPLRREYRVTYADWVNPLMAEAAQQSWRVFYLGSKPGVAERGAEILRNKFPGLQIITADGYFDTTVGSAKNQKIREMINAYQPNVLMVGMGMPRQEHWILNNLEGIHANAILTCGACIDYIAGAVPTPPRWMGRLGLEWLARLLNEPKRLWKRYLLEPWFVVNLFMRDLWTQRSQVR